MFDMDSFLGGGPGFAERTTGPARPSIEWLEGIGCLLGVGSRLDLTREDDPLRARFRPGMFGRRAARGGVRLFLVPGDTPRRRAPAGPAGPGTHFPDLFATASPGAGLAGSPETAPPANSGCPGMESETVQKSPAPIGSWPSSRTLPRIAPFAP